MKIGDEIEQATGMYKRLIEEAVHYKKLYLYSLIAHKMAIEDSTLTESETKFLLKEVVTADGKQLVHHLMNTDINKVYQFAIEQSKLKTPITPELFIAFNAYVMKSTGSIYNVMGGTFDSANGEYPKCAVTVRLGGKFYLNYQKIPTTVKALCTELNNKMVTLNKMEDIYNLSFDAHLNLVKIHPWVDGNGRTSRLLINDIQFSCDLIPAKVYVEDKKQYITSLIESQETNDNALLRIFMASQLFKTLKAEIAQYQKKNSNKECHFH